MALLFRHKAIIGMILVIGIVCSYRFKNNLNTVKCCFLQVAYIPTYVGTYFILKINI